MAIDATAAALRRFDGTTIMLTNGMEQGLAMRGDET
jgi:hypothetical protein